MPPMIAPRTTFDWPVYADATYAGMAVLVPVPLLDLAFEEYFRRRTPAAVSRFEQYNLPPAVEQILNQSDQSCLTRCATLPFKAVFELIVRLSRKLLYFLTVREATEKISFYWHRAFLIDYMLRAGHLDTEPAARNARRALQRTLRTCDTSPLSHLARHIVTHSRDVRRMLRLARQGSEGDGVEQIRSYLQQSWSEMETHFTAVAAQYDRQYQQSIARSDTVAP